MTKEYKITIPDQRGLILAFIIFVLVSIGSTGYDWTKTGNPVTVGAQVLSIIGYVVLAFSPNLAKIQKLSQEIEELVGLAQDTTEQVTTVMQQATTSVQKGDISGAINTVSNAVPEVQKDVQQATQIAQQTVQNVNEVIQQK